jgi:hypothetical protein
MVIATRLLGIDWILGRPLGKVRGEPPPAHVLPVLRHMAEKGVVYDHELLPEGWDDMLSVAERAGLASGGSGFEVSTRITGKGRAYVEKHRLWTAN